MSTRRAGPGFESREAVPCGGRHTLGSTTAAPHLDRPRLQLPTQRSYSVTLQALLLLNGASLDIVFEGIGLLDTHTDRVGSPAIAS